MRRVSSRFRRISAAENGFTLLELVFSVSLLLVVLASILGIFQVVQRQTAFVKDRTEILDSMRNSIDRMTKEIRQATIVEPASTSTKLEMTTYILGVEKEIVYEAAGEVLTRSVEGGTPVVLQDALSDGNVFTYTADTGGVIQVVTMSLSVHPLRQPETTLVLTSEVRIRNGGSQ
jgi:type II secretory pathway pseudopilin PulG